MKTRLHISCGVLCLVMLFLNAVAVTGETRLALQVIDIDGVFKDSARNSIKEYGNRSQVQGSTFRVKDKNGIKGPSFR